LIGYQQIGSQMYLISENGHLIIKDLESGKIQIIKNNYLKNATTFYIVDKNIFVGNRFGENMLFRINSKEGRDNIKLDTIFQVHKPKSSIAQVGCILIDNTLNWISAG